MKKLVLSLTLVAFTLGSVLQAGDTQPANPNQAKDKPSCCEKQSTAGPDKAACPAMGQGCGSEKGTCPVAGKTSKDKTSKDKTAKSKSKTKATKSGDQASAK